MVVSINRNGNEVWIYQDGGGVRSYAHILDTANGLVVNGDLDLLKLYNGTRRGLIDDDRLTALYKSLEGGAKPKD